MIPKVQRKKLRKKNELEDGQDEKVKEEEREEKKRKEIENYEKDKN